MFHPILLELLTQQENMIDGKGGRDSEAFLSGRPWEVEATQFKTREGRLLA